MTRMEYAIERAARSVLRQPQGRPATDRWGLMGMTREQARLALYRQGLTGPEVSKIEREGR